MHSMHRADVERLYTTHAAKLYGFLRYRTGDSALAEDLLADTFERALRERRRFDPRRAGEKTWLYAIALNLLRDRVRRTRAEQSALERVGADVASDPTWAFDAVDERERVARALERLSPGEREAIALRYGADLTLREIAQVTCLPDSTIEGRVYAALRKMREELGDDEE
jgi:RNA polymerase sigma-70 factor (ECF subfamily)